MELVVTLRNTNSIDRILSYADGVIVGSKFTTGFDYSLQDITSIYTYCKKHNCKVYIAIDDFIAEEELMDLNVYLEFISSLDVDGIYFHDFAVYDASLAFGIKDKLIYDGKTVLCNSLECAYYLGKGINGVVISRELTKKEVGTILSNCPGRIDMQIFGHLRLSYSKRKFISNYLKEIDLPYEINKEDNLYLVEEKRTYKMPVIEDESGTKIYSDFVFHMYDDLSKFKPYINRGIIDTLFLSDELAVQILRDMRKVSDENAYFLKERITNMFPNLKFSSAYLYEKTNITKDNEQD